LLRKFSSWIQRGIQRQKETQSRLLLVAAHSKPRLCLAPEDLKGGKKLHELLFDAVQVHDRLLLVLSEHNIQSEWVMTEKPAARRQFQP
jgi:hypothetical protein